jgi:2-oxoglutarate dehydrogenase E2 component (dihydrolipoamide succinyltransferase)
MPENVIMPQMGESLAEGTITKWLKKVGDTVERDEPLFEISTDKVDAEIPAPASGTLIDIKVGEGETVEVNTVVGLIGAKGEAPAESGAKAPARDAAGKAAEKPAAEPEGASAGSGGTEAEETEETEETESAPARAGKGAPATPRGDRGSDGEDGGNGSPQLEKPYSQYPVEDLRRVRSSPVVRKIAAEHNIDISRIEGHGISGRVTKKDILDYIESGAHKAATAAPPATARPGAPAPAAAPAGAPGGGLFIPDLRIPAYAEGEPVEIEPMTVMRKKIAEHMVYSQSVSAHVTSFFDIDFEEVARQRKAMKPEFAAKGVNLTFMPFVVRAVVEGLRKYPYLNAAVMQDKIVFKKEVNVGIAVALDEGKGLIVPVIRHADEKNLLGLARAINDLGERARTKKLTPDDVQRGTFSITNPGVFGGLMGTPIINQPQVAILGVGVIEKRPVVVNDAIAIRHRCYFTLSYDHRLVDGAMAEMFMAFVKTFIEAGNIQ